MREQNSLPAGWSRVALGDAGAWIGGGTPSKSNPQFWTDGTIPWVSPKDMKVRVIRESEDQITRSALKSSATRLIPSGSVLIVTRSGILERTLPVALTAVAVTVNQDMKAIVPDAGIDASCLAWAIAAFEEELLGSCRKAGTTVASIETAQLQRYLVPVAPLAEQRRIVAALEEHLSELDAAVAGLERARANAMRYVESVRASAILGHLNPGTEIGDQATSDATIPSNWAWKTLGECAAPEPNAITDGPFGSNLKTTHYTAAGPRVIRLQNIGRGVFLDAHAHISPEHFETLGKHRVHPGDLVIAALGESLPRACLAPVNLGPAIVKADCVRFRPNDTILLARYANIALNAEPTRKRVADMVHGVGRPRLNLGEIRSIELPIPPLDEQVRIADEVERRIEKATRAASDLSDQLLRATRLRQSILKSAFEGTLVPQDPNDEPASALLDRIRADRATHTATAPRRRPRAANSAR